MYPVEFSSWDDPRSETAPRMVRELQRLERQAWPNRPARRTSPVEDLEPMCVLTRDYRIFRVDQTEYGS